MELQNMTGLFYPSQTLGGPYTDIEYIITSQNIISRVMHGYVGILVPLGLLAGIFSAIILIKNRLRHHTWEILDFYLLILAFTEVTIILYSFTSTTRPGYLEASNLSCGVLSAFFNISYFFSQYLLLAVFFMLLIVDNSTTSSIMTMVIQNRLGCVSLTLMFSILMSLVTVSLLGTYNRLQDITYCQLDPLNAMPEYDFVKFTLGFCVPSLVLLIFYILLVVQARRIGHSTENKKLQTHMVILFNITVMFVCRLFYNIMLIRRTMLKIQGVYMTPREELVMNIAELIVFSGSCIRLIFTLTLHMPCREGLKTSLQFLGRKCRRTETPNSVI